MKTKNIIQFNHYTRASYEFAEILISHVTERKIRININ